MAAKLAEDSYGAGYVGKTASDYTEVDGISGATITSTAYKKALGTAFELYSAASGNSVDISEVVEEPEEELVLYTVDDANAALVPGGVTKYEQEVDKIREVYIANDKSAVTMVVTAQGLSRGSVDPFGCRPGSNRCNYRRKARLILRKRKG